MWVVILRPTFIDWLNQQTESVSDSIMANIEQTAGAFPLRKHGVKPAIREAD